MKPCDELVRQFKKHGYKMTPQRRAILEAIAQSEAHPTADELYETVRQHMPDTSRATVYNTLHELVAIKAAQELDLGHGVRRYDIADHNHAHRVCLECAKIEDVEGDFYTLQNLFPQRNGFCPVRYSLIIYGYCGKCSSEKRDPADS
jgi:Fe2+ or Zn2+ uptake regulation protein